MLPSFWGRIQTRLFLYLVIGIPVTLLMSIILLGGFWDEAFAQLLLQFLTTILILGLLLDPIYYLIQKFRWDSDWPFAYQFFFSIVEFGIVLALARADLLPWLPGFIFASPEGMLTASVHFAAVFILSFLALLGPVQIFYVRWRYKGGQFGKM